MKIVVGLFFGGPSVEHEVSIISAMQALAHFDTEKYELVPVYIARDYSFYTGAAAGRLEEYRDIPALLKKCVRVTPARLGDRAALLQWGPRGVRRKPYALLDVAFPVVHGTGVEDGALQGLFRSLQLPFMGCDVAASALGMDKYAQKLLFHAFGLPVKEALRLDVAGDREAFGRDAAALFGFPMVVKPLDLGSSVGIRVARDPASLAEALDYAFDFAPRLLAEGAVAHLRELNCAVLGDHEAVRASEVEEPLMGGEILSYQDKYGGGKAGSKAPGAAQASGKGMSGLKRLLPAPISPELRAKVQTAAMAAFQALGCCGVARVDFLLDAETGALYVNEINTNPGSLAFYLWEAAGLPYTGLLDALVKLALKRERERGSYHYAIETGILAGYRGGSKGKT